MSKLEEVLTAAWTSDNFRSFGELLQPTAGGLFAGGARDFRQKEKRSRVQPIWPHSNVDFAFLLARFYILPWEAEYRTDGPSKYDNRTSPTFKAWMLNPSSFSSQPRSQTTNHATNSLEQWGPVPPLAPTLTSESTRESQIYSSHQSCKMPLFWVIRSSFTMATASNQR